MVVTMDCVKKVHRVELEASEGCPHRAGHWAAAARPPPVASSRLDSLTAASAAAARLTHRPCPTCLRPPQDPGTRPRRPPPPLALLLALALPRPHPPPRRLARAPCPQVHHPPTLPTLLLRRGHLSNNTLHRPPTSMLQSSPTTSRAPLFPRSSRNQKSTSQRNTLASTSRNSQPRSRPAQSSSPLGPSPRPSAPPHVLLLLSPCPVVDSRRETHPGLRPLPRAQLHGQRLCPQELGHVLPSPPLPSPSPSHNPPPPTSH